MRKQYGTVVLAFIGAVTGISASLWAAPAPYEVVAECTPPAGKISHVGARILSNGAGGEVRAIVYNLLDDRSSRLSRQQETYSIQDASGENGSVLYSGTGFYLMLKPRAGGYIAGLSTRFKNKLVREKLECEFSQPRAQVAAQVLRQRKSLARR